ncbi:type II secretion system protein C (GspC) [Thiohalospira halophila DSM 15071]|uniref:Type II secretion system protein C (GspC) n=1 Tax=Thiohalospira halophila DSM 15071 TaxID=1123397 RepID=A0A1I1NAQ1_9GAMM|nr:type II secretion system protein GspC [Thiohalospira halophila]SFC94322.1 type II secretion system protein C (GspC) [Thiohalospira halophila DSM 15071]
MNPPNILAGVDPARLVALSRAVAEALLVVAIAAAAADIAWRLMPAAGQGPAPAAAPQAASVSDERGPDVARHALFGEPDETADGEAGITEAPETTLQLVLRGVIATGDPATSRAIIAGREGEEGYSPGDNLPGGAVLERVFENRVLLRRDGRFEELRMPRTDLARPAQREDDLVSTGDIEPDLSESEVRDFRDRLRNDPGSLAGIFRASPVRENGEVRGYRVRPGSEGELFRRFGFEAGDIITEVNGTPLDSPRRGMELMNQLGEADTLSVVVERDGQRRRIEMRLQ